MYLRLENFRINALKVPFAAEYVDENLHGIIAEELHIPAAFISTDYRIRAKSIDARRGNPELIYTLDVEIKDAFAQSAQDSGAVLSEEEFFQSTLADYPEIPDCSNILRNEVLFYAPFTACIRDAATCVGADDKAVAIFIGHFGG